MSVDANLMIEILKSVQADIARLGNGQEDIKSRLTTLEIGQAGIHTLIAHVAGDVARQQAVMHRVEKRIGRIERRLELTEEG